jgi:type IV secretion system protein VirB10
MPVRILPWLILVVMLSQGGAAGQNSSAPASAPAKASPEPAPPRLVVPANTTIPLELRNTISSRTAYVGQSIYCETIYPITIGNRIVIPVGSYVKGAVTQVIRPGRVKGKAQIGLRFESITLPEGTTRPLRATLSAYAGNGKEGFRRDESKIEGESSKGQDAGTVAITSGQGAAIGAIAGRSIKGAGIGAASGAVGGLIWVLATRGKEIVLPPGTSLEVQLTGPLTFEPDEVERPSRYNEGPALPRRDPGPSM